MNFHTLDQAASTLCKFIGIIFRMALEDEEVADVRPSSPKIGDGIHIMEDMNVRGMAAPQPVLDPRMFVINPDGSGSEFMKASDLENLFREKLKQGVVRVRNEVKLGSADCEMLSYFTPVQSFDEIEEMNSALKNAPLPKDIADLSRERMRGPLHPQ